MSNNSKLKGTPRGQKKPQRLTPSAEAVRGLTFAQLASANADRAARWHASETEPWSLADWSNALCGEAGELANVIKKMRRVETGVLGSQDPDYQTLRQKALAELADVVCYADLLAGQLKGALGPAVVTKFNEISRRENLPYRLCDCGGMWCYGPSGKRWTWGAR